MHVEPTYKTPCEFMNEARFGIVLPPGVSRCENQEARQHGVNSSNLSKVVAGAKSLGLRGSMHLPF